MSNTKKIALMSTLVLLLAVTAVFNFVLAGTGTTDVGAEVEADYFSTYRADRNSTRSEEFIQLDSVISAYDEGSEEYRQAVARKQELVELMEDELVMETILKSMGFSDAVVAIGNNENINVFVDSTELTDTLMTKIFSVLETEYDIRNGNVIIMPVYAES